MSALTVYPENYPECGVLTREFSEIRRCLHNLNVEFDRWDAECDFATNAEPQLVLDAYRNSIEKLKRQYGFKTVDVVAMHAEHPDKTQLRRKFLSEHTHNDFEVRFFVEGRGLFYLHVDDKVYAVLCERGDLISVPALTRHWFDMGENPDFKCIRLFTNEEGWIASFTDHPIAECFPSLDRYLADL